MAKVQISAKLSCNKLYTLLQLSREVKAEGKYIDVLFLATHNLPHQSYAVFFYPSGGYIWLKA